METNLKPDVYVIDLDGTLCTIKLGPKGLKLYGEATPIQPRIDKVNRLYEEGNLIKIVTARGRQTDQDWREFTEIQLKAWGVKYHVLSVAEKLHATWYVDDKGVHANDFFNDNLNEKYDEKATS